MSIPAALQYSARSLLRTPGLSVALLVTIALGAGSNAAVQGFISGLTTATQTPDQAAAMLRVSILLRGAAGAVLVVACANIAAFLLARSSARSKETSVRVALGANRFQLATQLLVDSVLISTAGGALGAVLAMWTANVVPALFFAPDAEQLVLAPDPLTVVGTSAACVAIIIACGLVPLFDIRRDDPARVLQRESAGPSRATRRLRAALVLAQMTCCCALIVSASLLLREFRASLETGVGQRLGDAILVTLEAPPGSSRSEVALHGLKYFDDAERVAQASANVLATAWAARPPGGRPAWQTLQIEPPDLPLREVVADVAVFTPSSLAVVTLPPIAGRMFGGGDTADGCKVVIVNEVAAQVLFDGDAVGRSIEDPAGQHVEIVGVVAIRDVTNDAIRSRPTIYYYGQQTTPPLGRVGPGVFRVPEPPDTARAILDANVVSAGYLDAVGRRLVAGEPFSTTSSRGCRVAVIDQAAADLYFDGKAVGGAVIDEAGRRTTIIGVVQSAPLRHWQRWHEPAIYFPVAQDFVLRMTLLIQTPDVRAERLAELERALAIVPGGDADIRVTTLSTHLSRTALAPERIATVLVGAAAATAFALGILGAYGVMTESARQRRRDLAVRVALGAQWWRVLFEVVGDGLRFAAAGAAAGMLGALLLKPWLVESVSSDATGWWPWLTGPFALMAAIVVATVLPARRALAVDPVAILREN